MPIFSHLHGLHNDFPHVVIFFLVIYLWFAKMGTAGYIHFGYIPSWKHNRNLLIGNLGKSNFIYKHKYEHFCAY